MGWPLEYSEHKIPFDKMDNSCKIDFSGDTSIFVVVLMLAAGSACSLHIQYDN